MKKVMTMFCWVVLPLFIGLLIYIVFRDNHLILTSWIGKIIGTDIVATIKTVHISSGLPNWMIFHLPDALWIFSFTSAILILWEDNYGWGKYFWMSLPLAVALGIELLQFTTAIRGTFDITDIVFYISGFLLAIILLKKNKILYIKHL